MKNKSFKAILAVFGLCLLLMVGCQGDEPNPDNPTTPSQTGGGTSEMVPEDTDNADDVDNADGSVDNAEGNVE